MVKVDQRIRWHYSDYTITILRFHTGARQHEVSVAHPCVSWALVIQSKDFFLIPDNVVAKKVLNFTRYRLTTEI